MTSANTPLRTPAQSAELLRGHVTVAALKERLIRGVLFLCALVSVITTLAIIFVLVTESIVGVGSNTAFFQDVSVWEFLTETRWTPQYAEQHFGILPLLCGTLLVAGIAALLGLPVGLASAVYLSEYASPRTRKNVKPILEILAGIPTIVYGYFALVFVTPYLIRPVFQDLLGFNVSIYNALSAGIVVGIMIIPMVSSMSEDALRSVPRGLREAGYALGSTKFDVSARVILPAAISGILASFLLAISRAIGETMAVTIAAGQSPTLTLNPFESVQTMTSFIVNVSQGDTPVGTPSYKSLYAIALTLFCMTLAMNLLSHFIMRRFREVYE
ncbi:MAG: phosphate ABC transporter permease subunit PstC [Planctomycetota bacterium]|nr:phosphate ABC transporter permease subunit PstC [Planctomycetota bacterium]